MIDKEITEEVQQRLSQGEMTFVEYINQHDQDFRDEYYMYCEAEALNPNSEDSAMSFIDYMDDILDESMEN